MIRELEQKVRRDATSEEKISANLKMEFFDKEIQDRAYQLLRRMPQEKGITKQGEVFILHTPRLMSDK